MDVSWSADFAEEVLLLSGAAEARVAPRRGGLVTGFSVDQVELLFLDRATLADPHVNVRGGIPVLFPNAGPLEQGRFLEKQTALGQHGFARRYPWQTTAHRTNALTVRLPDDPGIQAAYPFAYMAELEVMVAPRLLRLTLTVTNQGNEPLPVASGWHPYFAVDHTQKSNFTSAMLGPTWGRINDEVECNFGVPLTEACDVALPGRPRFWVRASPEHRHLQLWTLPGKDFICVEPWVGPNDALNHPEQRVTLAPGEARALWMEIAVEG